MEQTQQLSGDPQGQNSLAGILGELGLSVEAEQAQVLEERLQSAGWKPKQFIDQATKSAYEEGRRFAEQRKQTRTEEKRPAPETRNSEPDPPAGMDATQITILKEINSLKAKLNEYETENKALREQQIQKEINDRAIKSISELGLERPETVLALAFHEGRIRLAPDPTDGRELLVYQADSYPTPVDGPGTITTVKDYFQRWSQSDLGRRFRKVPEGAKHSAGISGGQAASVKPGPLSAQSLQQGLKDLGI